MFIQRFKIRKLLTTSSSTSTSTFSTTKTIVDSNKRCFSTFENNGSNLKKNSQYFNLMNNNTKQNKIHPRSNTFFSTQQIQDEIDVISKKQIFDVRQSNLEQTLEISSDFGDLDLLSKTLFSLFSTEKHLSSQSIELIMNGISNYILNSANNNNSNNNNKNEDLIQLLNSFIQKWRNENNKNSKSTTTTTTTTTTSSDIHYESILLEILQSTQANSLIATIEFLLSQTKKKDLKKIITNGWMQNLSIDQFLEMNPKIFTLILERLMSKNTTTTTNSEQQQEQEQLQSILPAFSLIQSLLSNSANHQQLKNFQHKEELSILFLTFLRYCNLCEQQSPTQPTPRNKIPSEIKRTVVTQKPSQTVDALFVNLESLGLPISSKCLEIGMQVICGEFHLGDKELERIFFNRANRHGIAISLDFFHLLLSHFIILKESSSIYRQPSTLWYEHGIFPTEETFEIYTKLINTQDAKRKVSLLNEFATSRIALGLPVSVLSQVQQTQTQTQPQQQRNEMNQDEEQPVVVWSQLSRFAQKMIAKRQQKNVRYAILKDRGLLETAKGHKWQRATKAKLEKKRNNKEQQPQAEW